MPHLDGGLTMKRFGIVLLPLLLVAATALAGEGGTLRVTGGVYGDTKGAGLKQPEGVAITGSTLIVSDTGNGRIVLFNVQPDRIEAKSEVTLPELPYPTRIAAASGGGLFVLDGKLRKIAQLGAAGEFKGYVELPAGSVPRSVKVDAKDNLWVLDVGRGRLVQFEGSAKIAREIPLPTSKNSFYSDFVVTAKGDVCVLDSVGRQVLLFTAPDTFARFGKPLVDELDFPTTLAADAGGRVYVVDQHGGGIITLAPDGTFRGRHSTMGWREGLLRYPAAIAAGGDRLFVADRENNRVEVFTIVP